MRRIAATMTGTLLAAGALAAAAAAGPSASAAPLPLLAISCTQQVVGTPGQPVTLARVAVSGYVADAIRATATSLPGATALAGSAAFDLGGPIPLGTVPDASRAVPGPALADAVVAAARTLPQLTPAGVTALRKAVAGHCAMTLRALGSPVTPQSGGTGTSGSGSGAPQLGGGSAVGAGYHNPDQLQLYSPGTLTGRAPMRDYGSIPAASPGAWAPAPGLRYGDAVPGYTPRFGLANTPTDQVRTAGDAQALPVAPAGAIALPMLIATLVLSVVTGTLVRRWVLRRA